MLMKRGDRLEETGLLHGRWWLISHCHGSDRGPQFHPVSFLLEGLFRLLLGFFVSSCLIPSLLACLPCFVSTRVLLLFDHGLIVKDSLGGLIDLLPTCSNCASQIAKGDFPMAFSMGSLSAICMSDHKIANILRSHTKFEMIRAIENSASLALEVQVVGRKRILRALSWNQNETEKAK